MGFKLLLVTILSLGLHFNAEALEMMPVTADDTRIRIPSNDHVWITLSVASKEDLHEILKIIGS